MRPILCVDFDGVLHDMDGGWQGPDVVAGQPVPGAFAFLEQAVEHFDVHVFSVRSNEPGGISAMCTWLQTQGLRWEVLRALEWPKEKPDARVFIDDKAFCFSGTWPDMETLINFRPWYKKVAYAGG